MSASKKSGTAPLLVEIGCEEIPARFLQEAEQHFLEGLEIALGENELFPPKCRAFESYSTPRRLAVWAPEVLRTAKDTIEEIVGPNVKIAFDAQGKPTRAAEGFATRHSLPVEKLDRVRTPKGECVAVTLVLKGLPAMEILPNLLLKVVEDTGTRFSKSMYWTTKSGPRFVRPIRWLLALFGEGKQAQVIPFEIAGVKSDDATYGHRLLDRRPIRVTGFKDYAKKLRQAGVEFDPKERRKLVSETVKEPLELLDSKLIKDLDLEDWIVNSTEWPQPILGRFEERFLKLPREILITVMRDHQKYFAVEDRKGNLQPGFVTVLNHKVKRSGLIRAGHERVLTARFRDAEFFWETDQRVPLRDRLDMLQRVTYQAKLGSYADKVRRMAVISGEVRGALRATLGEKFTTEQGESVVRALVQCKCDLTTHMVQEFTELEGIVGGLYARAHGEPPEVADAIYDHYLPRRAEDPCPRSIVGAVVSLVDKIDTIIGGFAVGNQPTGSSDPFGLRRAGNGIIKVLLELRLPISVRGILFKNLTWVSQYAPGIQWERSADEVLPDVARFLDDRLRFYLETVSGIRYDTVRAVLAAGCDVPYDGLLRAQALEAIRGSSDFLALSAAAKRIKNILAKSATAKDWKPGEPQEVLFKEEPERELYQAYTVILSEAKNLRCFAGTQHDNILRAFERIASLRPAVDRFFDKVLVMAEDRRLRENRLRLLGKLDELFSSIADLSQIESTTLDVVDASTSRAEKPSAVSRQPSANASGKRSG